MEATEIRYASIDAVTRTYRGYRPWMELRNILVTTSWFGVLFGCLLLYLALFDGLRTDDNRLLDFLVPIADAIEEALDFQPPSPNAALCIIGLNWLFGTVHVYLSAVVVPRAYLVLYAIVNVLPLVLAALLATFYSLSSNGDLLRYPELRDPAIVAGNVAGLALCILGITLATSPLRALSHAVSAPARGRSLSLGARPRWTHPLKLRAFASGVPIGLLYLPRRTLARLTLFLANVLRAPLVILTLIFTIYVMTQLPLKPEMFGVDEWHSLWHAIWGFLVDAETRAVAWEDEELRQALMVLAAVLAAWVVGSLAARLARRLFVASFKRSSETDQRPPLLFLRAFRDDQARVRRHRGSWFDALVAAPESASIDEMLLCDHSIRGPVIALGSDRNEVRPFGAARRYVGEVEDWLEIVRGFADVSAQCVLVAETSDGVRREADLLRQYRSKCVVLSSPRLDSAAANQCLKEIAARVFGPVAWPLLAQEQRIIAVFPIEQGLQLLLSKDSSAESYRIGLRAALYRQLGIPDTLVGEGPDDLTPSL